MGRSPVQCSPCLRLAILRFLRSIFLQVHPADQAVNNERARLARLEFWTGMLHAATATIAPSSAPIQYGR